MTKSRSEAEKIIELIARLNSNVIKDDTLTHVSDEQYDRILDGVKKLTINIYNHKLISPASHDRLDELTDVMTSLASMDFSRKATVDGSENHLDYIAIGLNLLSYQLAKQVEPMKILKAFFESLKEPIIVTDSRGKILLINNSAQLIIGANNIELYQKPVDEIIKIGNSENASGNYNLINAQIKDVKGELSPMAFSVYHFKTEDDRSLGSIYYGNFDVSKNNSVAGLNTLEEKNPLDFNRIHHDISGPIKSMKGAISLGKINAGDKETLKLFEIIEKCRQMVEGHFTDLFDMIFLKSSKLSYEKIEMEEMIKTTVGTLTMNEDYKAVSINISADPHVAIRSNKKLVSSILHNLISNALKYANQESNQSFVGIRLIKTSGGGCLIEVSDNGIGIKEENIDFVFKPHFRASFQAEGKGLGLYIVAQAVEKLGGKISVKSDYGKGTTFTLQLPNKK